VLSVDDAEVIVLSVNGVRVLVLSGDDVSVVPADDDRVVLPGLEDTLKVDVVWSVVNGEVVLDSKAVVVV
jgi:hypothetical protein